MRKTRNVTQILFSLGGEQNNIFYNLLFSFNARDFLFLTSYKSQRYCQEFDKLTESQAQAREVEERQYLELQDNEMDIWLKLTPSTSTQSKDFLIPSLKGREQPIVKIRKVPFMFYQNPFHFESQNT